MPREAMNSESRGRKLCIALGHFIHMIIAIMLAALLLSWMHNAKDINNAFDELCENTKCRYHDVRFYDVAFEHGPFSDPHHAKELRHKIRETYSKEDMKTGTRWTMVYAFSGTLLVLVGLNGIAMMLGAWSLKARALGGCCCCLLGLLNFVSIIVTAVCRFNTIGNLAAISLTPSKYSGEPFEFDKHGRRLEGGLSEEHTFKGDAKVILVSWIAQILLCCSHCCVMGYIQKPHVKRSDAYDTLNPKLSHDDEGSEEKSLVATPGENKDSALTARYY
uniref:Uncharacterized protein n=1 Tax=Favella ehrenbergii TaxID=182087 RepID=A0A7S3MM68_9SPIT|mmetsp:Transcript_32926/g.40721  ORF Transcript_32926/g.40721 Transcript_32926/m.40721 type:complete len:276 (+) Transcript_32926:46-873(+)